MTPEELDALKAKLAEADQRQEEMQARLDAHDARETEAALLREAAGIVTEALAGITLPVPTRSRLQAQLTLDPPLTEGAVDRDALISKVKDAAAAEVAYLAEAAGTTGRITGMGGTPAGPTTPTLDESEQRIAAALARI